MNASFSGICFPKKLKSFFILLSLSVFVFSEAVSNMQIIKSGHWIYDAISMLDSEEGISLFSEVGPNSAGELKLYLSEIDSDSLSDSGKELYDKAYDFLYTKPKSLDFNKVFIYGNLVLNPELYFKSNENIDWTFSYNYKDNLATLPFGFAFSDYVCVEVDSFFGKNYPATQNPSNFLNIPLAYNQIEFLQPRFAFGSIGYTWDSFGINLNAGKEGMYIGRTLTGSIIYNTSFETDAYIQLDFYSRRFKYTLDVVEISAKKFMYIHQVEIRPFKNLRFTAVEGSLVNDSFEIRFLNPLMTMHSFGAWRQYSTPEEASYYYGESHFGAYLAAVLEYAPVKYLRLYLLYAMNEFQIPAEKKTLRGGSVPNSLGFQLGGEFIYPAFNNGFWVSGIEGIYTSPFLYLKAGADWSFYKSRSDMQNHARDPICSWIGTPYGPDTVAGQIKFGYKKIKDWSCDFIYNFAANGVTTFEVFNQKENGYWTYYPSSGWKDKSDEEKEASYNQAQHMGLTGTVEYLNQIAVRGEYCLNSHFTFAGQAVYSFVFNCNNVSDNFQQGIELAVSCGWKLF